MTRLDTKFIYNALGLAEPSENREYERFAYALQAKENDVAFLLNSYTTDFSKEELAEQAMEKGAVLLISSRQIRNYPCLIVEDVEKAWVALGAAYRALYNLKQLQSRVALERQQPKNL